MGVSPCLSGRACCEVSPGLRDVSEYVLFCSSPRSDQCALAAGACSKRSSLRCAREMFLGCQATHGLQNLLALYLARSTLALAMWLDEVSFVEQASSVLLCCLLPGSWTHATNPAVMAELCIAKHRASRQLALTKIASVPEPTQQRFSLCVILPHVLTRCVLYRFALKKRQACSVSAAFRLLP